MQDTDSNTAHDTNPIGEDEDDEISDVSQSDSGMVLLDDEHKEIVEEHYCNADYLNPATKITVVTMGDLVATLGEKGYSKQGDTKGNDLIVYESEREPHCGVLITSVKNALNAYGAGAGENFFIYTASRKLRTVSKNFQVFVQVPKEDAPGDENLYLGEYRVTDPGVPTHGWNKLAEKHKADVIELEVALTEQTGSAEVVDAMSIRSKYDQGLLQLSLHIFTCDGWDPDSWKCVPVPPENLRRESQAVDEYGIPA
ncbi:hypothetical protein BKA93DRAFT_763984 [Sparassis latifolia]|uniref:Uncharacterized protein n=1 Tax=Sparassis crispa TaxID=139825 RepID=A0A401GKQ2_9APHY|nr:hypothetical protein SCP_0411360 [Sparassis crispa]GBE82751.1 hypothetical protein SCP_0411360 [Sparassis crispa]